MVLRPISLFATGITHRYDVRVAQHPDVQSSPLPREVVHCNRVPQRLRKLQPLEQLMRRRYEAHHVFQAGDHSWSTILRPPSIKLPAPSLPGQQAPERATVVYGERVRLKWVLFQWRIVVISVPKHSETCAQDVVLTGKHARAVDSHKERPEGSFASFSASVVRA